MLLFFSPHLRAGELARSRPQSSKFAPIYCCFFSRRISELASSLAADSRAANSQTSNLRRNPHILTRHRSTAELRVVGIETRCTESLIEEPSPESNNLAMSCLRTRDTQTCVLEKIAHGLWVHLGSVPWATSNRQTSQLALRRGASITARNIFTPLPHRL